jgi:hypothetical protein
MTSFPSPDSYHAVFQESCNGFPGKLAKEARRFVHE